MTQDQVVAIEQTAKVWSYKAWYYTIGGMIECGREALDAMRLEALEFFCSLILMLMGFMLMIPHGLFEAVPFARIMEAPILGSKFFIPLWFSGLIYILVARVVMHYTLNHNPKRRMVWLAVASMTWAIMLAFNLLSAFTQFPNALLMIMTAANLYLMDRANGDCYIEVQRENGTQTKGE